MNEPLIVNYRVQGNWGTFDYHSHQEYEIYFFHAGSCRYLIHNQIYDLEPGDILLMDGMTLHKPNVQPNSEYVRSTIHFSPQWIAGVLKEMGGMHLLDAFQKLHHCLIRTNESQESKQLEEIIRRLQEVKRSFTLNDSFAETEMKVLLLQVLVSVNRLGQMDSRKLPNKAEKAEHAEDIAAYIQSNYMHKLTLDSISEALNLSKSYVSHLFKEMTGFTVLEYLMGCRLTQVKYLLEMEPDKALKEVASESGFESVSHFSRYFREKVGMTASEFRRLRQ
ncbi:AraC family transcriptional regulator [Virgibacillus phasianinus]|uniref:AraC family transcriptional regulator n=1 Tax=Virgibacillus phasianinus TaxID=2017483 RepID=UPI0015603DE8|nr:AraC family transcriptional regulator [Virgibacillus phasianinus]